MRIDTYYAVQHGVGRFQHLSINKTNHGNGVRANRPMNEHELVCNISGPTITYVETLELKDKESYCLQVDNDLYIKPDFPFYYFNHSCDPNCGINQDLQLITIRPVAQGEELSWDYSTSMLERDWKLHCSCGSVNCRKTITDFDLLPEELRRHYTQLKIVMPFIIRNIENGPL